MTVSCDPEETRAIAVAGMALCYALAGMLKRTGVLDPEAVNDTFEAALSSLETALSADDPSAALARQILDSMGGQLAAHVEPCGVRLERDKRRLKSAWTPNSAFAHR